MAEFQFDLRDIFRIIRRRKWVLILSPILVGLLTYALTEKSSPIYRAESLVKISRVAANMQALLIEALSWYQGDNIATQSEIITSQKIRARVALRLAEKYGEFRPVKTLLSDVDLTDYDAVEGAVRQRPELIMIISSIGIQAERRGSSDIVAIQSTAPTEPQALDIVNYAAEEFVNYNAAERNRQIREAVHFIRNRIDKTEDELLDLERKLEVFKQEHSGALALRTVNGGAAGFQDELLSLQRRISVLDEGIQRMQQIERSEQYFELFPVLTTERDPLLPQLESRLFEVASRIDELESERRQLLAYHTEASREVKQNALKLEEADNRLGEILGALSRRYRAIRDQLVENHETLRQRSELMEQIPQVNRNLDALERQVSLKAEALDHLQSRLQDAEIQNAGEIKEVTIVQQATMASQLPQSSRTAKALVGLLIGILLGGVFAFVLESLDTSIGTIEEVERYVQLPVLGVIPHLDLELSRKNILLDELGPDVGERDIDRIATLSSHFAPTEPVSEAFRSLRAQLDALLRKNGWKTLMVTSSVLQEGKTSVACNLAVVFAQSGERTLLIDADLRRPQIHKVFGVPSTQGLSEVLLKVTDIDSAVKSIDDVILGKLGLKNSHLTPGLEYLFLLTCGGKVQNPAELLNPEVFSNFIAAIRDRYDIIVVDTAPVLPVADASQLALEVDAILATYQIGRIGREVINRSKNRLQAVGGRVIGLVMNDIEAEIYFTRDSEYYGYKYKYEETSPSVSSEGLRSRLKAGLSRLSSVRRSGSSTLFQASEKGRREEPKKTRTRRRPPPSAKADSREGEMEDIMKLTDEE